ncbi:ubiquitin carboxyl-terminal hydrolase [Anaeramoeba flamelloides]|uniref:Ubiquitin carboxyl-terminal hydrolase n=1 Tax=Anaeramoeba flamelloides TaxID=1746091 RepID=A0AAV8AAC9_9EUKA|nr:ubiquitin carboxyl-terminal hydrolase [Anaeramoeba flamelloides]
MELLNKIQNLKIPDHNSYIHKEECTECFDSIDNEEGIEVCLHCYNGGCVRHNHGQIHAIKFSHPFSLNIRRKLKPEKEMTEEEKEKEEKKITKLAIGVEGGFKPKTDEEKYDYFYQVHYWDKDNEKINCLDIDRSQGKIEKIIEAIIFSSGATIKDEVSKWENQKLPCVHGANIVQEENVDSERILKQKTCTECEFTTNLWMCMSCGYIGCGRKQWDGSGANDHGYMHYKKTGHCIVVKLGTITPEGEADVHCYKCDKGIIDDDLTKHLLHLGLRISEQKKTEKTISELELEKTLSLDFGSALMKDGKKLIPICGPGLTGMKNIGNTCYISSVLQSLFFMEPFRTRYYSGKRVQREREMVLPKPETDLGCQLRKIAFGILSGEYSGEVVEIDSEEKESTSISPRMLKNLIGKDHPEFSTMRQQDAMEFLTYFLDKIHKLEHKYKYKTDPTLAFDFKVKTRLECLGCKQVRYKSEKYSNLSLTLPSKIIDQVSETLKKKDLAKKECEEKGEKWNEYEFQKSIKNDLPEITIEELLNHFVSPEVIELNCESCKSKAFKKNYLLETFPEILTIHIRSFIHWNWVPTKVLMKLKAGFDPIDLSFLQNSGIEKNEKTQEIEKNTTTQEKKVEKKKRIEPNQEIVNAIVNFGFPQNQAIKAALSTNNASTEIALNWLLEHQQDSDINDPFKFEDEDEKEKDKNEEKKKGGEEEDGMEKYAEIAPNLTMMGFSLEHCKFALYKSDGDMERAANFLFNYSQDIDSMIINEREKIKKEKEKEKEKEKYDRVQEGDENVAIDPNEKVLDGNYQLSSYICHLGSNASSGHYVSYIKNDDKWVLCNDSKIVIEPENVTDGAYILFYKRK